MILRRQKKRGYAADRLVKFIYRHVKDIRKVLKRQGGF